MKTLLEVLQSGTDYLARQGCDEARATMQHLMAHVLHCNRTALYSCLLYTSPSPRDCS